MEPNYTNSTRPWQWIVTALVVIALIALGIYMITRKGPAPEDYTGTPNGQTTSPRYTNRILVTDQYPGNIVYISSVELEKGGYVVIHKNNAGKPGAIIGSAYFDVGVHPGQVNLSESTVDGATYYAMLHSDNGDKVFSSTQDTPILNAQGQPIMQSFKATTQIEDKG